MSGPEFNYYSTFIRVAEDCPVDVAEVPPERAGRPTAARVHFEMCLDQPYRYRQDQILFHTFLTSKDLSAAEHPEGGETWHAFFDKGRPCLRSSALGKRYGWGLHFDPEGRVVAVAVESEAYRRCSEDSSLDQLKAMRNSRRSINVS